MTTVLKLIYKNYYELMQHYADPRTEDLFLAQNPLIPIGIIVVYQQFVENWGPRFMKNRPAFNLNKILIVYNLVQIILSVRFFYYACRYTYVFGPYRFMCEPVDYSTTNPLALLAAKEMHNYYLVKIIDLLDTVFFVLRKKQRQITFLHKYHHMGMVFATWVGTRFIPGGHVVFIGFINCFVHIIMYSYYLKAIFDDSSRIWWKKYITLLQIVRIRLQFQFGIITVQWVLMLLGPSCGFPKILALIFLPQNTFMTAMFLDFYYKAYIQKFK